MLSYAHLCIIKNNLLAHAWACTVACAMVQVVHTKIDLMHTAVGTMLCEYCVDIAWYDLL